MATKRVLSLGQCGADHARITWALERRFDAEVVPVHAPGEALSQLRRGSFALVLVNRILDGDGSSGIEFVKQVKADEALKEVPVMLVSNYDDAQREAVEAGAEPGFGKAALEHGRTFERLKRFLGDAPLERDEG